jgi:tRNA pseudouridine38-40 synthase
MGKDDSSNTISGKIEEVLMKMTGEEVELFCGCRTEKGVHAYGQVANVKLNTQYGAIEIKNYLNRYLPRDIAVLNAEEMDERFHSQLNAKKKIYVYRLDTAKVADVFERKYAYHTFEVPDFDKMKQAAAYFIGKHDFKTFTTAKKSKSTIREIESIDITQEGSMATITITANDFLHNMARYMIGMMLDAGNGLKEPEDIKDALDGNESSMSLPAESYGLFLKEVLY